MDITLRQLQMLREVAARGTMVAAAESLGFTPSAVSQQIGALEKAAGVEVFERIGRNVRLTDAGAELLQHAEVMIAELDRVQATLESVGGTVRGVVRLAVVESVASTLLAPMLAHLAEHAPEVELHTRQQECHDAYKEVLLGDLDLTFDFDYPHAPQPPPEGLTRIDLFNDWFRIVVPAGDDLDGVVDLGTLQDRPFISSPPTSCGRCVAMACRDAGFEPELRHQVDDYPATLQLVAGGAGVGLVPDLGLIQVPDGVKVLELKTPVRRAVGLTRRSGATPRPSVQAVIDAARAVVDDQGLDGI